MDRGGAKAFRISRDGVAPKALDFSVLPKGETIKGLTCCVESYRTISLSFSKKSFFTRNMNIVVCTENGLLASVYKGEEKKKSCLVFSPLRLRSFRAKLRCLRLACRSY